MWTTKRLLYSTYKKFNTIEDKLFSEMMDMDKRLKEIYGALTSTLGTIESAIGSTPSKLHDDVKYYLNVKGNVLQAVGNALEVDGQASTSLEKIGNQIQSIGNLTVIAGLLVHLENQAAQKLVIIGNMLQAIGSIIGSFDEFQDTTENGRLYNIIGGLLQGIGNSMQALDGAYQLHIPNRPKQDFNTIGALGSWIQAIGSEISLIGQIKEESQEINENRVE